MILISFSGLDSGAHGEVLPGSKPCKQSERPTSLEAAKTPSQRVCALFACAGQQNSEAAEKLIKWYKFSEITCEKEDRARLAYFMVTRRFYQYRDALKPTAKESKTLDVCLDIFEVIGEDIQTVDAKLSSTPRSVRS